MSGFLSTRPSYLSGSRNRCRSRVHGLTRALSRGNNWGATRSTCRRPRVRTCTSTKRCSARTTCVQHVSWRFSIRVRECVWIVLCVHVPVEVPSRLRIRRDRINGEEPPRQRLVIPLLHVQRCARRLVVVPEADFSRRDAGLQPAQALMHLLLEVSFA
jgi:hypothetical protein